MIQSDRRAHSDALHARPVADRVDAVEEGHRAAAAVTGGAQRKGAHVAALDAAANAGTIDVHAEQLAQRRVIEQRLRRRQHQAAGDERQHPVRAGAQHVMGIDMEHLARMEVGPHALESRHRAAPVVRLGRQHAGGYGTRRGTDDDRERVARARQHLRERQQHPDLVSRTGAAPRQHKGDRRAQTRSGDSFCEPVHSGVRAPLL